MRYREQVIILHTFSKLIGETVDSITIMEALQRHPMPNSARMISDVLDAIGIPHEAFLLSRELLESLQSPAILYTMPPKRELLVITPIASDNVIITSSTSRNKRLSIKEVLRIGEAILFVPTAYHSIKKKTQGLKSIIRELLWGLYSRRQLLYAIVLIAISFFNICVENSINNSIWIILTIFGILVSALIEAKRNAKIDSAVSSICKIKGEDTCNAVINTPLMGIKTISLADISLSFFLMVLFSSSFGLLQVGSFSSFLFYSLSLCFLGFSLVWQVAKQSFCPLCLVIDGILILSFSIVILSTDFAFNIITLSQLAISSLLFFAILMRIISFSSGLKSETELINYKDRHSYLLSNRKYFWDIINMEEPLFDNTELPLCNIDNNIKSNNCLVLVLNPKCKQCKNAFDDIYNIKNLHIIIILYLFPQDFATKRLSEEILANENNKWEKLADLMRGTYKSSDADLSTNKSYRLLNRHSDFIEAHSINATPAAFINGRPIPNLYSLKDLSIIL